MTVLVWEPVEQVNSFGEPNEAMRAPVDGGYVYSFVYAPASKLSPSTLFIPTSSNGASNVNIKGITSGVRQDVDIKNSVSIPVTIA